MKENQYDNEVFFKKYAEMARSQMGLAGAGEWETLCPMMPDLKGKSFLDLGCGFGWHCMYAAHMGADEILGVDLSRKMLETARQKSMEYPQIQYRESAIEDLELESDSWDVVMSSLAIHYLASFDDLAGNVWNTLKRNGVFIFTVEHPVFTAEGSQDWLYDEKGEIRCFPVDRYYYEGKRMAHFLGEEVTKYHRTITTYMRGLLQKGFVIEDVAEPRPPENMLHLPGMKDELRRPMMLIVKARKG